MIKQQAPHAHPTTAALDWFHIASVSTVIWAVASVMRVKKRMS